MRPMTLPLLVERRHQLTNWLKCISRLKGFYLHWRLVGVFSVKSLEVCANIIA